MATVSPLGAGLGDLHGAKVCQLLASPTTDGGRRQRPRHYLCGKHLSPLERRFTSTLTQFAQRLDDDNWNGPLIIFVGIGKAQVSHAANATALKELSHVSY